MPICSEARGYSLLAVTKAFVPLFAPLTEFPLATIQFIGHLEPFAKYITAANHVPRLQRLVHTVPGFIQVSAGLGFMGGEKRQDRES